MVNPVTVPPDSPLHDAQAITYESMRVARDFASREVDVRLLAAQYPEDRTQAPAGFQMATDLDRSILDLATFQVHRKLPLLGDVLARLPEAGESDLYVYTNVDISLLPHFYLAVRDLHEGGFDAFSITRRTVSDRLRSVEDLPLLYSDPGRIHPGFDCFVFTPEALARYELGDVAIGVNWVGRVLLWNMIAEADRFAVFKNLHLTFHLGNDRTWKNPALADYEEFNTQQAAAVRDRLVAEHGPVDRHPELLVGKGTMPTWAPVQHLLLRVRRWLTYRLQARLGPPSDIDTYTRLGRS